MQNELPRGLLRQLHVHGLRNIGSTVGTATASIPHERLAWHRCHGLAEVLAANPMSRDPALHVLLEQPTHDVVVEAWTARQVTIRDLTHPQNTVSHGLHAAKQQAT